MLQVIVTVTAPNHPSLPIDFAPMEATKPSQEDTIVAIATPPGDSARPSSAFPQPGVPTGRSMLYPRGQKRQTLLGIYVPYRPLWLDPRY